MELAGLRREQGIQSACPVEGQQIIAAADVFVAYPDLWNRAAAACALAQRLANVVAATHVDFLEIGTLLAQELLRHMAIAAMSGRIDCDLRSGGCLEW